jgi:lipoyl synthase
LKRKPVWLKTPIPHGPDFFRLSHLLKSNHLNTVCKEAKCPNMGECWANGRATFMILGDICTRSCKFCNVRHGIPEKMDAEEPQRIVDSIKIMKINHVVITSVTRDDLSDCGANHFAEVIKRIKEDIPQTTIEVLIPDMCGKQELLDIILDAEPDVFNHNTETVRRLTRQIRSGADYDRSLSILVYASRSKSKISVKSGFMVGMGEEDGEAEELIHDLKDAGCSIITIGQYLQPSRDNIPVARYVEPEKFEQWKKFAENIGIDHAFAGPLVRSSYRAHELFETH